MLAARRSAGRPGVVATKSSPTDVVTQADRTAEDMIIERIRADRPGDGFLGEEGGQTDASAGPGSGPVVRWIIDPLDGTVNYLYGLPDFAVSIAAEVDGEIMAGVVDVPERGEVFTAVAGGGAWLRVTGGHQSRCAATAESRWPGRWWRRGSATRRRAAVCRVRWWPRCCRWCETSGGPAAPRWICAH